MQNQSDNKIVSMRVLYWLQVGLVACGTFLYGSTYTYKILWVSDVDLVAMLAVVASKFH